jgi:hypothetical protein
MIKYFARINKSAVERIKFELVGRRGVGNALVEYAAPNIEEGIQLYT